MRFLFSLLILYLLPQQSLSPIGEIKVENADRFTVDQFQNLYFIHGEELTKTDPHGKQLYSYSDPLYGTISQVDVFNPLKPYLFYKDYNRLVVLDNRLNVSNKVDLTEEGFLDVQFMSFSDQDNAWLYDQSADKLFRFNLGSMKITNQSLNITQLLGSENTPAGLVSTADNIYLNVPGKGIMVFGATGSFLKLIPFKKVVSMDANGKSLLILNGDELLLYNPVSGLSSTLQKTITGIRQVKFCNDTIYVFYGNEIRLFKLPQREK